MVQGRKSDDALLKGCQAGDDGAWEELILRYRRLIYSIPHSYRLGSDAADEVFQRVCLILLEKLSGLREAEKLASWLTITTRRECWAWSRGDRRTVEFEDGEEPEIPVDPPDVVAALELVDCEHALVLAFERLGEPCHGLLHALYVEDPTPAYAELAERLDRPIGSLGPTKARCLTKLKKLYDKEGGREPPPE
jgi:RNA polymerase sigma factor (sigma-70 family)